MIIQLLFIFIVVTTCCLNVLHFHLSLIIILTIHNTTAVWDDFESARDGVLRWLADINERLGETWNLCQQTKVESIVALQEITELQV